MVSQYSRFLVRTIDQIATDEDSTYIYSALTKKRQSLNVKKDRALGTITTMSIIFSVCRFQPDLRVLNVLDISQKASERKKCLSRIEFLPVQVVYPAHRLRYCSIFTGHECIIHLLMFLRHFQFSRPFKVIRWVRSFLERN